MLNGHKSKHIANLVFTSFINLDQLSVAVGTEPKDLHILGESNH